MLGSISTRSVRRFSWPWLFGALLLAIAAFLLLRDNVPDANSANDDIAISLPYEVARWEPLRFDPTNTWGGGLGEDTLTGTYAVTNGCLIITDVGFGIDDVLPVFSPDSQLTQVQLGESAFLWGLLGTIGGDYVRWVTVNPHDPANIIAITDTILGEVSGLTIPAGCPTLKYVWISS